MEIKLCAKNMTQLLACVPYREKTVPLFDAFKLMKLEKCLAIYARYFFSKLKSLIVTTGGSKRMKKWLTDRGVH